MVYYAYYEGCYACLGCSFCDGGRPDPSVKASVKPDGWPKLEVLFRKMTEDESQDQGKGPKAR